MCYLNNDASQGQATLVRVHFHSTRYPAAILSTWFSLLFFNRVVHSSLFQPSLVPFFTSFFTFDRGK
jgi:hypothetical protein